MSPLHFNVQEHAVPCQYIREYPGALLHDQEDTLHLHVKQYQPKDQSHKQPGAVTIIGTHANAFPKELYEPLWDEMYQAVKERGQAIKSVWIADISTQGMSGVLNEDKLGNDASWNDHVRDLLHMVNHFRRDMPRPLVGIGHSMGANHLTQLSYMHPRLLSSLVLIDPVIHDSTAPFNRISPTSNFARSSTFRRDHWPSRAQAAASFRKSKFYQTWDPRVLDLWIEHGLRDLPSRGPESAGTENSKNEGPPVTLTTNKPQEAFMFLRSNFEGKDAKGNLILNRRTHPDIDFTTTDLYPFYRPEPAAAFKNLPHLRPSALYLFGGTSELSVPESRKQKVETTGIGVGGSGGAKVGRVKEVVVEGVGHLVPMIAPRDVGVGAADFLAGELRRWKEEEDAWRREWEGKSRAERVIISEEWKRNIGGDPRVKSPPKL